MRAILPELEKESAQPLYLQLFDHIRGMILEHDIVPGEKLPSLRDLSESLELSLTTVTQAYDQLLVEGYVYSVPKKGYFVSEMYYPGSGVVARAGSGVVARAGFGVKTSAGTDAKTGSGIGVKTGPGPGAKTGAGSGANMPENNAKEKAQRGAGAGPDEPLSFPTPNMAYDLASFDFVKWKKCLSRVLNEHPEALLFESDPQGEEALRYEIAKYVYTARGVRCTPDRVVVAAGTQQITAHLATILRLMGIENVALEEPGYTPVRSIFRDRGFAVSSIPVGRDGIEIEKLPMNIPAAAYVAPQNQFPTGAMMPVSRRYRLLDWAKENNSYIIEDDYDSELRYFGKPALALQGIDTADRVVYLGSFSSTLFASIKISYMILPPAMAEIFADIRDGYTQSCSKTEQLALALFMESGAYMTGIKKLRRLYAQKLRAAVKAFEKTDHITPHDTNSGVGLILDLDADALPAGKDAALLVQEAAELGVAVSVLDTLANSSRDTGVDRPGKGMSGEASGQAKAAAPIASGGAVKLYLYYSRMPLAEIPERIEKLAEKWYHSK